MGYYEGNGGGMSPADMAAVMGGNRGGYGMGGFGDFGFGAGQGFWVIILFLLFAMNGNGWGNGFSGGAMPFMMNGMNTNNDIQRGFDQQTLVAGIGNLTNAVQNGFANAEVSRCNSQANILQTLNQNQNATTQGMNQLAMSLQQCCCDNRQATADLRYTVATEACADRQAVNDGIRDVIANQTANTQALINSQTQGFQAIQDKLCQLELDGYKQKVSDQAAEIAALKGAASQVAQTAALIQDNNQQTANLIRAINPAPVPSYQVPNPYTGCCGNQGNYGCCG